jgi:hypothetical protein
MAALALATGGLVVVLASPASAHCSGHSLHPDLYGAGGISFREGARIRSHPHVDCTIRGLGNPNHGIDVHCRVVTGTTWYFVRNTSTGVNGWTRWDALNLSNPLPVDPCHFDPGRAAPAPGYRSPLEG